MWHVWLPPLKRWGTETQKAEATRPEVSEWSGLAPGLPK